MPKQNIKKGELFTEENLTTKRPGIGIDPMNWNKIIGTLSSAKDFKQDRIDLFMITKRKICVVTGTRAEYGLLRWVIDGIKNSLKLELQLVVTGMHLSPGWLNHKEILNDGYRVDKKVEMLLSSDSSVGICKSIGLGVIGFADALNELEPDILILLGDRFEILSAAIGGMSSRIPIAHIHGGESTEGLIDESIRHSITKLSHVHFVATDEYRKRIIQLGGAARKSF